MLLYMTSFVSLEQAIDKETLERYERGDFNHIDDDKKEDYESDSSSETSSMSSLDDEFINQTVEKLVNKKVYVVWDKINMMNMAIFDDKDDAEEYCNKLNKKIMDLMCKKIREERLISMEPMSSDELHELEAIVSPFNKEHTDEEKIDAFASRLKQLTLTAGYELKFCVLDYPLNRKGLDSFVFKGVHLICK